MSAFTSFIEVLPHAHGLNNGPNTRKFLLPKDYREWQLHTPNDMCGTVYQGDKLPDYLLPYFKGENVVREFYYDPEGIHKEGIGWMVIF